MIKPIVLYGKRILREQAKPFKIGENVKPIIQDLWDTMYNAGGAGLAGPQISIGQRIFVVDVPFKDFKGVFINPQIKEYFGKDLKLEEGCLSLPQLNADIIRPAGIEIEWYDENWEHHVEKMEGMKSRVIQHEYDHLEGTLWIDKVDPALGMHMLQPLRDITYRTIDFSVGYPYI